MSDFRVTSVCENGHAQTVTFKDGDRLSAETWAGLTDGTSPFYLTPPNESSVIGKCAWSKDGAPMCGARFKCSIEEIVP